MKSLSKAVKLSKMENEADISEITDETGPLVEVIAVSLALASDAIHFPQWSQPEYDAAFADL